MVCPRSVLQWIYKGIKDNSFEDRLAIAPSQLYNKVATAAELGNVYSLNSQKEGNTIEDGKSVFNASSLAW
jgi:hypothetical protein